ncbi:solute carrier family 66 member 2 [Tachysurus ichikawai]
MLRMLHNDVLLQHCISDMLSELAARFQVETRGRLSYLDVRYFWRWSAFEDYLLFCFGFTLLCAFFTLFFLDWVVFVESLGSLAVLFEAMLGLPQLLQNYNNGSTRGMSAAWSVCRCHPHPAEQRMRGEREELGSGGLD